MDLIVVKWFKAGFSFILFCMLVIYFLPIIFPGLKPVLQDSFQIFSPTRTFVSEMTVREENLEFRRQLAQNQYRDVELESLQKENRSLRASLKLPKRTYTSLKIFEIYQRHPACWNLEFFLSVSNSREIDDFSAVLVNGYLAGVSKQAGKRSLHVRTILHSEVEVPVYISGTAWTGLMRGEYEQSSMKGGKLKCFVDNLPRDAEIKQGSLLRTVGLGNLPKDILVAKVLSTQKDEIKQTAIVEVLAPIEKAQFVSVVSK